MDVERLRGLRAEFDRFFHDRWEQAAYRWPPDPQSQEEVDAPLRTIEAEIVRMFADELIAIAGYVIPGSHLPGGFRHVNHEREQATPEAGPFFSIATAGEAYAGIGWQIFPVHTKNGIGCTCRKPDCSNPAKHPRTQHGVLDATNNLTLIQRWQREFRYLNWGLAAGPESGVFIIDIDPRHGGDESWEALEAQHGWAPKTVEAKTPGSGGRGRHLFWRYPRGVEVRNREGGKSGMPDGLDVRGKGGYVILAPSMDIEGRQYEWVEGQSPQPARLQARGHSMPEHLTLQKLRAVPMQERELALWRDSPRCSTASRLLRLQPMQRHGGHILAPHKRCKLCQISRLAVFAFALQQDSFLDILCRRDRKRGYSHANSVESAGKTSA